MFCKETITAKKKKIKTRRKKIVAFFYLLHIKTMKSRTNARFVIASF